jgi:hypothetical protein
MVLRDNKAAIQEIITIHTAITTVKELTMGTPEDTQTTGTGHMDNRGTITGPDLTVVGAMNVLLA